MKNKFFKLIEEELEDKKNSKKIEFFKISLLLYAVSVSKVVYEELENLRDDNYLFLEYLNYLGFEYNLESSYLENVKIASDKLGIFKETYDIIINHPSKDEYIECLEEMEMELKLDILRGRYIKIAKNYTDNIINLSIMHDSSINQLALLLLGIQDDEILYNIDFFEENNFYNEKINNTEKNVIIKLLSSMANLKTENKSAVIITKDTHSDKLIYDLIKNTKKGIVEKEAIYSLKAHELEEIIKIDKIESIISMPLNGILKNQIIIFNEEKVNKNNIFFIQSQHFFEKGSEKIKIENLKDLSEIFEKREEINGISRSIPNETILNKGCNLDILNYVFKTKEKVDLEKLKQKKINSFDLMKKSSNECDNLINKYLEEIN